MKNRSLGTVALVASAAALTWSTTAGAQEFLHDPRVSQGAGLQAGDFDVHPGLAAEIGYDSNYFNRSDKSGQYILNGGPANPPIDSGILRITPSIAFAITPGGKSEDGSPTNGPYEISVGANGTYREFLNPVLSNQRNISANAFAGILILPGREWSGSVSANFWRAVQPSVLGNPDISYNNDLVGGTAELIAHPHLGTLDWRLGYTVAATLYEQTGGEPFNNLLNTGYTRGQWRFGSQAAFLFDGQLSYHNYLNQAGPYGIETSYFPLHASMPLRVRVGLEGLITPVLSVVGMVGYGATLTQDNFAGDPTTQQYSSVIGNLEVRFSPGGPPGTIPGRRSLLVSTISLGYNRDFAASFLGDFVGIDRGYLKADYFFGGKFIATLQGGVGAIEHPNLFFTSASGAAPVPMARAYSDVSADATAFAEYRVIPSVGIDATLTYLETFSDTQLPSAPNSYDVYDMNVRRITAFLGVRWFM